MVLVATAEINSRREVPVGMMLLLVAVDDEDSCNNGISVIIGDCLCVVTFVGFPWK